MVIKVEAPEDKMAILPIIKIGHPTLRKTAQKVEKFDKNLKKFVDDLTETMHLNEGIGLAATQVNCLNSLAPLGTNP